VIRPFGDQRGALAIFVKAKLAGLGRIFEPVEIGVDHRQAERRRIIGLDDGEGGRWDFACIAKRMMIARASVVLPAPSPPSSATTSPARSRAAMRAP
jgi:hypothetical protein